MAEKETDKGSRELTKPCDTVSAIPNPAENQSDASCDKIDLLLSSTAVT